MTDMKVIIHDAEPDTLLREFQTRHPDAAVQCCNSYEALAPLLEEFRPDAVFTVRFAGTPNFPTQALLGPAGPKWIAVGGSGVDHLGRWDTNKVTVTNSAGVAADMMAEYALGAMLHFTLDFPGLERDRQNHRWTGRVMTPMKDRHLLIVGLGHTGQAVARLAKAFGMTVTGVRANPRPTPNVDRVHATDDLGGLWGDADYIMVCAPLLDSTRGLIGAEAFAAMKPGAVLVDVSRGGIVQQTPLLEALRANRLSGAALDVFETEPLPADSPLWDLDNIILSPHCSSVYKGWELGSVRMFADNLDRWRRGEPLFNVVDPARGY